MAGSGSDLEELESDSSSFSASEVDSEPKVILPDDDDGPELHQFMVGPDATWKLAPNHDSAPSPSNLPKWFPETLGQCGCKGNCFDLEDLLKIIAIRRDTTV